MTKRGDSKKVVQGNIKFTTIDLLQRRKIHVKPAKFAGAEGNRSTQDIGGGGEGPPKPCMRATALQRPPSTSRVVQPRVASLRAVRGSVTKLFRCCVGLSVPPEHNDQQAQLHSTKKETSETPEFSTGFTQLGPDDVSYKVRTEPKMVHQYVLGEVLGEGI